MKLWRYVYIFLCLCVILVWIAVLQLPDSNLHIVACDVGQGDGILIYRGTSQILVDGGPNSRVVECLERHLPFWDREIELVVLTHPQADHFTGLVSVFEQYAVGKFVASEADSSSRSYQVLKEVVGSKGISVVNPRVGMELRLGLMSLDILSPNSPLCSETRSSLLRGPRQGGSASRSAAGLQSRGTLGVCDWSGDLNDLSVVFRLSYGEFDGLFTGDLSPRVGIDLVNSGNVRDIEYLKVPHHGSKNGLTKGLLDASRPEVAVVSSGRNNRYGHPHKEVLEMLSGIKVLRTDLQGDVEVISDGKVLWMVE